MDGIYPVRYVVSFKTDIESPSYSRSNWWFSSIWWLPVDITAFRITINHPLCISTPDIWISVRRTLQGQAGSWCHQIACWSLAEGETKSGEQQPGSTFPDVAWARPCCRIPSQSAYNGPALNIFNIRPSSWCWGAGLGVGITLIQYLSGICPTFHG